MLSGRLRLVEGVAGVRSKEAGVVSEMARGLVVWPFTLGAGAWLSLVLERMAQEVCQSPRLELPDTAARAAAEADLGLLPARLWGAGEAKDAVLRMAASMAGRRSLASLSICFCLLAVAADGGWLVASRRGGVGGRWRSAPLFELASDPRPAMEAAIRGTASFASPAPQSRAGRRPRSASAAARAAVSGGSSRGDWQTSCAILSSTNDNHAPAPKVNGQTTKPPAVSDTTSLDLTPATPSTNLKRPLSISDLSPAPLHGAQLRVAYQGVPGAYSEAAAGKAYPDCDAIPCDQFEVAFQAVELWIADRAVLPVENSLGGSIHRNYDLLLRHRLHIVGEVQLPVHHCLLALPGVRRELLARVISHPQALAQCEHTLTRMGLNVAREAHDDTAGAAQHVAAHGLRDTAAIASARAAELYGLAVLADGIQDDASNVTRFVMLAREPIIPRTDRPFKTSIVLAHDREGTSLLFKVLSAFAFRDISLTKIESRPHRHRPIRLVDDANVGTAKHFEYMFYIDFQASMADVRAQNALAEIQEFTSFLRVLGSYPMDMTPWDSTPPPATPSSSSSSSDQQQRG